MKFDILINQIEWTHQSLYLQATKAINISLTLRNWLIGFYIVEYEQNGADRANYGDKLIDNLAERISINGLGARNLKLCRQFYTAYPQIMQTVPAQLQKLDASNDNWIMQTVSAQLQINNDKQLLSDKSPSKQWTLSPEKLINHLSFSHLTELMAVREPLQRTFYEIECIKGNWSVRELKRQINSLYFERSGMSVKPELLSEITQQKAEIMSPADIIKSVYAFEFLGLKAKDAMEEQDLETALLDHLQDFMLEMDTGFAWRHGKKRY